MKNNIPCEMIRDLFPSYIDKLTSHVTNQMIEEHLMDCSECSHILESMKEPSMEPVDNENKKEIDFLKRTRKKIRGIITGSIFAAIAVVAVVLLTRLFLIGAYINSDYIACTVNVDGDVLMLSGAVSDERLGISNVEIVEEEGIVIVSFKSVQRSLLHSGDFEEQYIASEEIKEVRFDDKIVWSQGEKISTITSAVYNTRHLYIGDMSKNGRTAAALNAPNYLGGFKSELQTSKEPYGWKMILENAFSVERGEGMEKTMKAYAYVFLATIGNLGEISYEYMIDDKIYELSITSEEATSFAGEDIKIIGQDVNKLQKLMEQTGLVNMSYVSEGQQWRTQDTIQLDITNLTEEELSGISISYYIDGKPYGTQGTVNADGSVISKGQIVNFTFISDDFGGDEWEGEEDVELKISVYDKDGNTYEIQQPVHIAAEFGCVYGFKLSGNAESGYVISQ